MSKVDTLVLKELRKKKKVIQATVAQAVGIGRTNYVKIENGIQDADTETLIRLADYFGVSVDYLLGRTDTSAQPSPAPSTQPEVCTHYPPDIIALAEQIQGLPPSARALVEHQVKVLSDMDKK